MNFIIRTKETEGLRPFEEWGILEKKTCDFIHEHEEEYKYVVYQDDDNPTRNYIYDLTREREEFLLCCERCLREKIMVDKNSWRFDHREDE